MGQCEEQADCLPDGIITGTSVATVKEGSSYAFEDLVANSKLVEHARAFEGNVHYELVKSAQGSNDYRFIEKWSSLCLLYTSPSPRDMRRSRMPSSA